MKTYHLIIPALLAFAVALGCAQKVQPNSSEYLSRNWKAVATGMPSDWYASAEARMAADSVLKYQTGIGGWMKNSGFHNGRVNQQEWAEIQTSGIGATFDNDATITEMKFLAKIYEKQRDERYRKVFLKALDYIFEAQYPNGGWPQFYPNRGGRTDYSAHITYNDNAMINVMRLLIDIVNDVPMYKVMQISDESKIKAQEAFEKGVECILRTQIVVDGAPTIWCAQHDEITLAPAKARSYELESFSGGESAGIVLLLMEIEDPSEDVIAAVNGAVKWFDEHRIRGIRVESFVNQNGERDRRVVEDSSAPDQWARFYDLETGQPYFCDRDGIKKGYMAEIGIERRGGYRWYVTGPEEVIQKYHQWAEKRDPVSCFE